MIANFLKHHRDTGLCGLYLGERVTVYYIEIVAAVIVKTHSLLLYDSKRTTTVQTRFAVSIRSCVNSPEINNRCFFLYSLSSQMLQDQQICWEVQPEADGRKLFPSKIRQLLWSSTQTARYLRMQLYKGEAAEIILRLRNPTSVVITMWLFVY